MAAVTAFQEQYFGSGQATADAYTSAAGRATRYQLLWSMYENTAYREFHQWAKALKVTYGLYEFTRGVFNPAYRLGEFWKAHLFSGALDPDAGDGETKPSALPIVTKNEAIRPAISKLWSVSNWQVNKDILSLKTAVLGDGYLMIVDDPERKKVYLKIVDPTTITELVTDDFGNVRGYIIEESRDDPRIGKEGKVKYREVVTRDGVNVVYQTYLNEKLFAWNGITAEWAEPYGFVPLVALQHNNVGMKFGWSVLYPGLPKIHEVNDLASKLSDHIRKFIDPFWLFAGVRGPAGGGTPPTETTDTRNPEKRRQAMQAIYSADANAKAQALVAPLDIVATANYIMEILKDIEKDYPELAIDIKNAAGDISGKALRINRAPAESKVIQVRPNYDNALVRAHQMAIAIGGFRGYDGFAGFGLDSYAAGALDHSIGARPVFDKDATDDLEMDQLFWTVGALAKAFGIPPLVWLEQNGYSEELIAKIEGSPEFQARIAGLQAATDLAASGGVPTQPGRVKKQADKPVNQPIDKTKGA
jgi:hypothetical protein